MSDGGGHQGQGEGRMSDIWRELGVQCLMSGGFIQ